MHALFGILGTRRFLPLFATQFLGALNDNLFKNALVILILYRIADQAGLNGQVAVTIAAGLFILPFFLFSATAGQLADKFDKAGLIRRIKLAEIAIMALGAYGLAAGGVPFLMAVLFLMGTQSTFFGPLKYAILPQHLAEAELVGGNGLIEAGTFLAILIGTIAGGLLILGDNGIAAVSIAILAVALAGWLASFFIPAAPAAAPGLAVRWNIARETASIIRHAAERRDVFLSILGISWFWLVGATFLSQFPTYAKDVLGGDEQVVTLFLILFSVGIGVGSLLCAKLLDGEISARTVPFGALGMALFSIDLYAASGAGVPVEPLPGAALAGAAAFLSEPAHWRILADLLLIAVCGGFYIVPLYAILQSRSDAEHRARTIAGNNVINALFMVIAAGATAGMLAAGVTVTGVFLTIAIANLAVAVYVCRLLPHELLKSLSARLFRLLYRVEVTGLENLAKAGERAVVVVNHVSFLDGPLLAAFLPGRPMFAIDTHMARRWWVKPFLALIEAFPLDPTNPLAVKPLIRAVQAGKTCVIFPEGRITVTGRLMKVYEGPGMIADKAGAMIVPVRIDGAQWTPFTRLRDKVRRRLFPKITITVLEPRRFAVPPEIVGRRRRQAIGAELYDVMSAMMFQTDGRSRTLFEALLDARATHGGALPILDDIERTPVDYDRFLLGSLVLGRRLAALAPERTVGVMLPNATATAVTLFALQAFGRIPAMLNFSSGAQAMLAACKAAGVTTVVTSRRFVDRARLQAVAEALGAEVRILYLEDVRAGIGWARKLRGLLDRLRARALYRKAGVAPQDPAVVLFTSGSEGAPKGVVLTHENLLANCRQLGARIDFNPSDKVFNALPLFHAFGLTGGLLLPILNGVRIFLYPSPLHYRIIPELVYGTNATVLFATDTFLTGYGRMAHPYDFYSLRYVFAGAERVREATRRLWMEKFGLRILEGYGATECAPVIAVNTPMHFRAGTVGRLLPGIEHRLEPVPGIDSGGRLLVRGPNVMKGYLRVDRPGELQAGTTDGWYDTGDIVEIDGDGFVTIRGRAKRFAKIAGEMVSLGAVEDLAAALWPADPHAAVALPDSRKGEQIVLATTRADARREDLVAHARERGAAELMVPKTVLVLRQLPLLGTGKTDYVALRKLVEAEMGAAAS